MSTKTNDPKQTAPETEPVVDDIKTEPVTPDAEEKADKKTAQKEGKETEPKASKEPKESKEKKETKKEIEADLAAEKDKYLRLLAEYDNFRRRSARRCPLRDAQKVPAGVRQPVARTGTDSGR